MTTNDITLDDAKLAEIENTANTRYNLTMALVAEIRRLRKLEKACHEMSEWVEHYVGCAHRTAAPRLGNVACDCGFREWHAALRDEGAK